MEHRALPVEKIHALQLRFGHCVLALQVVDKWAVGDAELSADIRRKSGANVGDVDTHSAQNSKARPVFGNRVHTPCQNIPRATHS